MQIGTTLTRFIIEEERQHPEATGEFTGLLTELASAAKIISRDVNKAGLAEVMGITGRTNVHGEEVQRLDEFANSPRGKLRPLYEAAPLAFIVEQAGGAASDGEQPIMDLLASELHQRTPLFIGSCEDVATLEKFSQDKRVTEGVEGTRISSV